LAKKKNVVKAPREMTHRQLSHHRRAQRRQKIIVFSGIAIVLAVVVLIISGWVFSEYRPMHRTVIKVYDTSFSMADFVDTIEILGKSSDVQTLQQNASGIVNTMINNELIRQGAEQLGISVSDEEVKTTLQSLNLPDNRAARELVRAQLLPSKIKSDHFGAELPVSANQVYVMTMLTESDVVATEVRDKLINGDNFTMLAEQYGWNYTTREVNKGDYGWHPASILKDQLGSDIPIDWAFSATPGEISPPLKDTESYKKFGYWLLRVNGIQEEGTANVSAVLLSSEAEAQDLKMKMENGSENLTAIADTYSQYSPSKESHGELGMVMSSENISDAFNGYVYNPDVTIGVWSDPIPDTTFYTQGGDWIVKLVGKEDNRKLSDDDRNKLIEKAYNEWTNNLWVSASADIIKALTDTEQQWAIDRAVKALQKS
jgi:parvulin-like peptidyl-prolyl isomerase